MALTKRVSDAPSDKKTLGLKISTPKPRRIARKAVPGMTKKQIGIARAVFAAPCPNQEDLLQVFAHVKRRDE